MIKSKHVALIFAVVLLGQFAVTTAFADSVSFDSASYNIGQDPKISGDAGPSAAFVVYDLSGLSNPPNVYFNCPDAGGCPLSNYSLTSVVTGIWGASMTPYNGSTGTIGIAVVPTYDGGTAPTCTNMQDCIDAGYTSAHAYVNITATPLSESGIGGVIDRSTSTVQAVTGFGMPAIASWMWENLGKPISGSGFALLYTLRYYIMALIALSAGIYFGFRYYKFMHI